MSAIETVKVVNEASDTGYMIINKSDFDPDVHEAFEASDEITRETVDKMKKADVLEYLAAHGVTDAEGSVAELRARLKEIMFVEL